jgi:hypothetical protein
LDTVSIGWRIRVSSDGQAFIVTRSTDTSRVALLRFDLKRDSQEVTIAAQPRIGGAEPMVRSPDASLIILPGFAYPDTVTSLYDAVLHTYYELSVNVNSLPPFHASLANSPYNYLVGHLLSGFAFFATGYVGLDSLHGAALGPDGTIAYAAESECGYPAQPSCLDTAAAVILQYSEPTSGPSGALTEAGKLLTVSDAPRIAQLMVVSPDGKALIGIGSTTLMAFDLTHTVAPPPSSSLRVRSPSLMVPSPSRVASRPMAPRATASAPPDATHATVRVRKFTY